VAEPFLGEIRCFSFAFPPKGWALCDGQLLPINQNAALFSLLGTQYGGNGTTTFALPNLEGRSPVHAGGSEGYAVGQQIGVETVGLSLAQVPAHSHPAYASSSAASASSPSGNLWAANGHTAWSEVAPDAQLGPGAIAVAGSSQAHDNRSPFLVLNYCVALQGIFPSRT
jgi:microcystin-dependent protein